MQKRFFLIGFMGSGKSYHGRRLAQLLNLPFIDLDHRIEIKAELSIREIFERFGEARFRELEAEALHATLDFKEAVVACGGGTPCFGDNMDWMNRHGVSIYLDTPVALLADRLTKGISHRPLLKGLDQRGLLQYIEEKLAIRLPFYDRASIKIRQESNEQDLAGELAQYLTVYDGHVRS